MSNHASHSFTQLNAYRLLKEHFKRCKDLHMRRLFSIDPQRHQRMSLQFDWLLLDYSKNRITDKTLSLLFQLAREAKLEASIESMFCGHKINRSENRAVLHTALRNPNQTSLVVDRKNIIPDIQQLLARMQQLTKQLHAGKYLGYSKQKITDVVNIGIGSTALGSESICKALTPYHQSPQLNIHFVSNIDGAQIEQTLGALNPETTVFIIASQSFKTAETLAHFRVAKQWLSNAANGQDIKRQLIAVTGNQQAAEAHGIHPHHIFHLWEWIDSRHAIWSAAGLPIMLSIGTRHFRDFLQGAHEMDQHFYNEPFETNMPVILALIGIWYTNFFGAETQAILPYDHYLADLPRHIEQVDMSSNNRAVDNNGHPIEYATGSVIWSGSGLHNQHAFYQLLHRGKKIIPADFIVSTRTHSIYQEQHDRLFANAVAQTELLMRGRTLNETLSNIAQDKQQTNRSEQVPHRVFDGNNPSNMLMLQRVTPKSLGILMALYEHKVFTQSVLWNINAFDQWSTDLGNTQCKQILQELHMPACTERHDASTNTLIKHYRTLVYPEKDRSKAL